MKWRALAARTAKEILRDPLNIGFGLGFPLVLILLLSAIQAKIPVSLYEISSLTPAITVFGLSFMSLFSATLLARDRESALLQRLYTTPLRASDFILGYLLPMLPLALLQTVVCYLAALPLGLSITPRILSAIVCILPCALLFISLGLLCGSLFGVKQVGGICGALLTNLTAWLSGMCFDLNLVGGAFLKIANLLPFVHAVKLEQGVLSGQTAGLLPHALWVLGYAAVITLLAILCFLRQMKRQ